MRNKLTKAERIFFSDFVKYCAEHNIDYNGYNVEQMEAHMLDFVKHRYGEDRVEVLYDKNGDMSVKILKDIGV